MKKVMITVGGMALILCTAIILSASTCNERTHERKTEGSIFQRKSYTVQPDSTVIQLMGKEAGNALFTASKATLYRTNPAVRPTDQDETIGGVRVEGKVCNLSKPDIYMILYLLSDSLSFSDTPLIPTTPFAPTAAIEFNGKGGCVSLLFSMTSQEVGVVWKGRTVKVVRYTNARLITRYFAQHLNEQFYYNILKQLS